MWVFPLVATLVALVFAIMLGRQFADRRRPYQALWAVALLMYAVASLAVLLGVLSGWNATEFRIYWLFGAMLNVPYLAAGEVHLLSRNRSVAVAVTWLVVAASVVAAVLVFTAEVPLAALFNSDLPAGKHVWADEPLMRVLASALSYAAYLYLVAATIWSAWKMRGAPELRNRFFGTLGIAIGATVVAAGAAFAVKGLAAGFSITLATGIAIMFWGFLRASRPAKLPQAPQQG